MILLENWEEIIVSLTALYGAILSTALWFADRSRHKRNLHIACRPSVSTRDGQRLISISVINIGLRPVVVDNVGLLVSNNGRMQWLENYFDTVDFPLKLNDGEAITAYQKLQTIHDSIIEIREKGHWITHAYAMDSIGTIRKVKLPTMLNKKAQERIYREWLEKQEYD